MADKIKPLKFEDPTNGTGLDFLPTEANPTQDYAAVKGIAFENNDNRTVDLNGSGYIQFKDAIETVAITVRQIRTAISNIFSNVGNGFTATNVQSAIEEARDSAPGKARASITCTFNGAVGNNDWLGYNESLPGDNTPIRIPWACVIKEISVSYSTMSGAVDGALVIYKNGTTAGNIVYTETFTNISGGKNFFPDITLAANDSLRGRWTDAGDNPSDMAIVWFLRLL